MAKQRYAVINGVKYELKPASSKNINRAQKQKEKSLKWFEQKLNVKPVKVGFQVALPTKKGVQKYDAVEFDNHRIAVFLKSGYLKYAWADA